MTRRAVALGLAPITALGAVAAPSLAWLVPVLAVGLLLLLAPQSSRALAPARCQLRQVSEVHDLLLSAAAGAAAGLAYMLAVIPL